jgi:hypothetical protein
MNRNLHLPVKLASLLILIALLAMPGVGWGQILTFEFSALAGNEVSATSNSNDANLTSSTITRGAGLTASANGGRFNATNWALTSIANAVSGNNYMEFTITPNSGYQFSVSSIDVQWQRSGTGNTAISLRSSLDSYATDLDAVKDVVDNTTTQTFTWTFTQENSTTPVTYRLYSYAEATGGSGGPGDGAGNDIIVNGAVSAVGGNPLAETPVFSPIAGTYYTTQNVILTCDTEASTIYYTTDGSDPDDTDTEYTTAIPVSSTTTIKAIAYADGHDPSEIATATYTIITQFAVTFYVDMSNQTGFTNVDIAGSFNNWGDPVQNMTLAGNGIYTFTTDAIFTADQNIEFKFRKDGDWNTSEPGSNRSYTVVAGPDNEYHAVYSVMWPATIGWVNLQWPDAGTIITGGNYDVYARVFMTGVTEPAGQGANISAWIGYSTTNSNPNTWTNWVAASYNFDYSGSDEYLATLTGLAPGTYYYASRFQYSDLEYVYGGFNSGGGNFWNGVDYVSGVLTVNAPPMPNAWINEFHYDNDGTDAGEFVEVVVENASQVNLAELRVHLYNGNGGVVYGTSSVDFYVEGITSNGFTMHTLAISGIQNGAPDGLALSYYNILVPGQFLSYEGTFEATDGPALGITSVDIGVSENGTGAVTNSLQLGGAGTEYSDFFWQPEATNTLGLVNYNQSFFTSTIWNGSVSTAWEDAGNWTTSVPVTGTSAIISDEDNDPVISGIAFVEDLVLSPGALLTLTPDAKLTVSGNFTTSEGLIVQDGASLITEFLVSGSATIQKTISDSDFHLFILPIVQSLQASPTFIGYYVDDYIEANGEWTRFVDADNLLPLRGYSIANESGAANLEFFGNILAGDQAFLNLSYTPTPGGYGSGWNLLGNPFLSAIDMDVAPLTATGLNGFAYVWTGSNYVSGPLAGGAGTLTENIIPSAQGFFVRTESAMANLTIPNAARVHSTVPFYKSTETFENTIMLTASGNGAEDRMMFAVNPEASAAYDSNLDAYKLFGNADAPQLYTTFDEQNFSISTVDAIEAQTEFPVMFMAGADGSCTITASFAETFMSGSPIILTDLLTGLRQDLRQNPVYAFNATTGDDANRFKLSFATLGIGEKPGLNIGVYAVDGKVRVLLPEVMKGTVNISNLSGQALYSRNFSASGELTVNAAFPAGVYLVTVITSQGTKTRKVFVN